MVAMVAHDEIALAPINMKSGVFYRHLVPLRNDLVLILALTYRRCFRLALAHPDESRNDPNQWAWGLIQPAIIASQQWLRDWYILACDGENQSVQKVSSGSIPFVPGGTASIPIPLSPPPAQLPESWRSPAWLFQVSLALFGVGPLKEKNVPANDSGERLSASHTRLLRRSR
jgi:hypothetical protein